jgi:hypothetical protein
MEENVRQEAWFGIEDMTTIEVQPKHEQHLARWTQLGADRELAKLPYKIETDRLGRILVWHSRYCARIDSLML